MFKTSPEGIQKKALQCCKNSPLEIMRNSILKSLKNSIYTILEQLLKVSINKLVWDMNILCDNVIVERNSGYLGTRE